MKKKEPEIIFNIHEDSELEALAKAYVQAANARNMTSTQAKAIIGQIWREDITDPIKKAKLQKMPLKETPQQEVFREKAKKFVEQYPEFNLFYKDERRPHFKDYTLEVICAIHKMFTEEDYITLSSAKRYIKDYFKQTSEIPFYYNDRYVNRFTSHILEQVSNLTFKTTDEFSGVGVLQFVDTTFTPIFSTDYPTSSQSYARISWLHEPYKKCEEYDCRKNKTNTSIIHLIWVIETFF